MRTLVVILVALSLAGCTSEAEREVRDVSTSADPALLKLGPAFNDYVRRILLPDGTEAGIITCRDGSSSRFWFRSHHITGDDGGTLFRLSDGEEIFMAGYFCCEVQLPERQFVSLSDLRLFIRDHQGFRP